MIEEKLAEEYNINIMGIKRNGKLELLLSPDVVLAKDTTMLVLGRNKDLQKCFTYKRESCFPDRG